MIVDDNAEIRALIRSLLSDLAEEIVEYGDGESALANYDKHMPDWSLVDVGMPVMDGFAVTSWIKRHHREARVLVMSQTSNPQMRAVARESGATVFVPKENLLQLRSLIMGAEQPISSKAEPQEDSESQPTAELRSQPGQPKPDRTGCP
jgi:CheY-like chemotaxis protein